MKVYFALFFLILGTFQFGESTNFLSVFRAKLDRLQNLTEGTLENLRKHKVTFHKRLGMKLSSLNRGAILEMRDLINPSISDMEASAEFVRDSNENVTFCLESFKESTKVLTNVSEVKFGECTFQVLSNVNDTAAKIDRIIEDGLKLMKNIDEIFDSCKEGPDARMNINCLKMEVERAGSSVRRVQHSASCAIESEFYDGPEAELDYKHCTRLVLADLMVDFGGVLAKATECVENF